jgi:hypothetical protein
VPGQGRPLFLGVAKHFQPILPAMLEAGAKPNKHENWIQFYNT